MADVYKISNQSLTGAPKTGGSIKYFLISKNGFWHA
jgi:hypothetical protein